MRIDIITLFPDYFTIPLRLSVIGRAIEGHAADVSIHNLRDYATDAHKTVDDTPYGGGPGMVLKVDVVKRAIDGVISQNPEHKPYVVLLTPQGQQLDQPTCRHLARRERIILICGHYEGFDERIRDYVDVELSIGPYVLSGGEPAALVVSDAVIRLLPGATGHPDSTVEESFSLSDAAGRPLLEYPQYTRPEMYDGKRVPEILLSGNHQKIAQWRQEQSRLKTNVRRPSSSP